MMKALLIDDIASARASLRADIEDYCPDVEIIGEASGVVSAAKAIRELQPDLLFLDIELGDGDGFDLLDILGKEAPKVIFTTSSNEHAIRAFRCSAVDYLLKPVDPELLKEAVSRAMPSQLAQIETLKAHLEGHTRKLALNSQEKVQVVDIDEIVRCESTGSYTLFFLKDGEQVLVTRTLKEYDQILSPMGFVRVHQSHLVNLDHIREFVKAEGGYLVLKNKEQVPVSSRKRSEVLTLLQFLK